jgi:small subunit ribosomal protein S20
VANVPSAEKRNRQRIRRRQRNLMHLTRVRTSIKKVRAVLAVGEGQATELLSQAVKLIDKAAQKGVIKRKTASRKISRLTRASRAAQQA